MDETTKITNTLFKSNKISFETKDDDYRFVKSTQNIKKGEILLIEHCYTTDKCDMLSTVISKSPELFNNLYPRKMSWNEEQIINEEMDENTEELCYEKAQKNAFGDNGLFYIGLDISNFNHSDMPNACVSYSNFSYGKDTEDCCNLLYIYSNRNITNDEEITIWYNVAYFDKKSVEKYKPPFKLDNRYIENIHIQYMKKDICKNIMFNHMCNYYGLYLVNDMICPTKRFLEYFKNNVKKECNQQNIIYWMVEQKKKYNYLNIQGFK